jgi:hypothetical protein
MLGNSLWKNESKDWSCSTVLWRGFRVDLLRPSMANSMNCGNHGEMAGSGDPFRSDDPFDDQTAAGA